MADTPDPLIDLATPPDAAPDGPIVARPGNEYRIKRALLVLLLFGYGAWSAYDGFVKMPRDNQAASDRGLKTLPHPAYDIPFNQAFGVALPPLALLLLGWSLYNSRGEYRLDGDTLHLPGHPPVPLSAVMSVDRRKWDRKGIATFDYQLPDGAAGRGKLDDFIYQRLPTDQIFDRLVAAVSAPVPEAPAADPA